ncbi:MAG TPA: T9SS type A sorting domain-containing protein [Candidatus Kapabacteria bacterium]|nr:T9SS type A sorting domain-containing protein [Candidatus Kapabacteria bacterium]
MKMLRFLPVAAGLLAAVMFFSVSTSRAQRLALSDTIDYPIPDTAGVTFGIHNFGPIAAGQKECHTIWLRNTSNDPLVIKSIDVNNGNYYGWWTDTAIPPLPVLMLHNDIVSIAEICFTPGRDDSSAESRLVVYFSGTVNGKEVSFGTSALGYITVDTNLSKPCVVATLDNSLWGPLIIDGDISRTMTLQSNRKDSIEVDTYGSSTTDGGTFVTSGITFPYLMAPFEKKSFTVSFSPRSNASIVKYRYVGELDLAFKMNYYDSGAYYQICNSTYNTLAGVAIPPTADSISTALNAGSTDVLAMISDNSVVTHTFFFKNTGTTKLKVTNVSLKNGKSFSITNITPTSTLPFTLSTGDGMSVTVTMSTSTNGVYYDEVIITAEAATTDGKTDVQSVTTMNFALQGLRKNGAPARVGGSSTNEHVSIYPNPSHSTVTAAFPGVRNATVTVMNLVGSVVARQVATDQWIWNADVPAGMYVIQVSGTDANGNAFFSNDRCVIEK